jgi:hypothetical protein
MVNGSLLDPDQTTSRALPHAKDDLRPVFLNRVDKLFAMKANWKDKLSEIFRSRKVLDDPTGDIVGKPFVRTEPVDENAHAWALTLTLSLRERVKTEGICFHSVESVVS